jgi:CIC family chloride channel protein
MRILLGITLAAVIGVVAALGSVGFRAMIAVVHNAGFLGVFSAHYDASVHTAASPWGVGLMVVPALGAIVVTCLVTRFAPEAKGHGVPEVMDAVYYNDGRIRPIVAGVKAIASAITIGTGGSVGREGPIAQIGSAFGSALGQWTRATASQRVTLVASGAAGGIAATFNTPIAGLLFAVELLLPRITSATLLPVAVSTVVATYFGRLMLSDTPAFAVPDLQIPAGEVLQPASIPFFVLLGLTAGLAAAVFIRCLYWFEDLFDRLPGGYFGRHICGMALLGALIVVWWKWTGHYDIQGIGYASVEDVLNGRMMVPWFLAALFMGKLIATCLTLGSGGSGGVFSPSLLLGATLGGLFGVLAKSVWPTMPFGIAPFAMVGLAAMVAGTTGAVLTAIVMLFEMTLDYAVAVPVLLAAPIAYATRRAMCRQSIYTLKLARRGRILPQGLRAEIEGELTAVHIMSRAICTEDHAGPADKGVDYVVRIVDGQIQLRRRADDAGGESPWLTCRRITASTSYAQILGAMRTMPGSCFAVVLTGSTQDEVRERDVQGVITHREVAHHTAAGAKYSLPTD